MSTNDVLESFVSLRRTVALVRAAEARDFDYGHNQIAVLYRLLHTKLSLRELAEYTLSDKASMTRTVTLLEKKGFVKRVPSEIDRRVTHIELTPKGRVEANKAQDIRKAIAAKLNHCLTLEDRKKFSTIVNKIVDQLQLEQVETRKV